MATGTDCRKVTLSSFRLPIPASQLALKLSPLIEVGGGEPISENANFPELQSGREAGGEAF